MGETGPLTGFSLSTLPCVSEEYGRTSDHGSISLFTVDTYTLSGCVCFVTIQSKGTDVHCPKSSMFSWKWVLRMYRGLS